MKKIVGYIIAAVGLVGIAAYVIPEVRDRIPLPSPVDDITLLVASIIITLVGVFFIFRSGRHGSQKSAEVPVFRGKDVVAYRRT